MAETVFGGAPARAVPVVAKRRNRQWQLLLVALVIVGAIGYLVYNGLQTKVYYQTVSELQAGHAARGQQVRLAGNVVAGSVIRQEGSATIQFQVADAGGTLPVTYSGAVPDIFGPGIEVVVEGKYDPAHGFVADTMLAKCPSKFEGQTAPMK